METLTCSLPDSIKASWPSRARFARLNGYRMPYIDEGQGDPVGLLHCCRRSQIDQDFSTVPKIK